MKRFVEGTDRGQSTLFPECLEDWIDENNPVRVIDVFVDELNLGELGFDGVAITFGAVRGPQEVIKDSQLQANDIVVPLEGAGGRRHRWHKWLPSLRGNFRRVNPAKSTIILLERNSVLPSFAEPLSRKAVRRLERLGVKVMRSQGLDWYSLCALTDRRRPVPWGNSKRIIDGQSRQGAD
jgi:hypothetical protein